MKILVTGSNGLLGPYIIKAISNNYTIYTCSRTTGDFQIDLSDIKLVKKLITHINPDIIVHCAAYTNVEEAENKKELAYLINQQATKNIVENLSSKCHFIYISTDQVYADSQTLHKEGTENPVNVYGKSKWCGAIEASKHNYSTILHTNMFGPSLNNSRLSFTDIIINALINNKELSLYSDTFFSPLHFKYIAHYINIIIEKKIYGTYNLGSRNGMSKEVFIIKLAKHLELSTINTKSVISGSIKHRTKRTLDLRLDVNKIENKLGFRMPNLIDNIKIL
jgi:dTDP-4-dehydrorhamnose reductase